MWWQFLLDTQSVQFSIKCGCGCTSVLYNTRHDGSFSLTCCLCSSILSMAVVVPRSVCVSGMHSDFSITHGSGCSLVCGSELCSRIVAECVIQPCVWQWPGDQCRRAEGRCHCQKMSRQRHRHWGAGTAAQQHHQVTGWPQRWAEGGGFGGRGESGGGERGGRERERDRERRGGEATEGGRKRERGLRVS